MLKVKNVFSKDPEFAELRRLTEKIFPPEEVCPEDSIGDAMPYQAYYDGDTFVGFTRIGKTNKFWLVLYLAILPEFRSGGYGGMIMDKLIEEAKDIPICLDIEPIDATAPNYEQRVRRLNFYKKHGIHELGYTLEYKGNRYAMLSSKDEPWENLTDEEVCELQNAMDRGGVKVYPTVSEE